MGIDPAEQWAPTSASRSAPTPGRGVHLVHDHFHTVPMPTEDELFETKSSPR